MSTLHTINKSPYSNSSLSSCIKVCSTSDAILLLEDGVFGAIKSSPDSVQLQELILLGVRVFAISADVKARGLTEKLMTSVELIDYDSFVQLTIEHRCVQSWY
ncbi:sulfurtransferase complex subunit TusB [Cellvibrio sp. QJXJ]|uniref:sulfurtransferase complex subunit TusB n=1 Tax=Cellvibrio sp. QJXJ TaxID=2964606 RepID=UPI0021C25E0E|nr:sulfurtransferase complex subunit TusB [Cellvibrio sp. QJXJ]UUA73858.1 sulfurtransferase complex subunit TusB [Cellvibrio sp. QJXJ]